MKVIRAGILGFCTGVRRAVDMAWNESVRTNSGGAGKVYTLGPLIHNSGVLKNLEEQGVIILEEGQFPPSGENSTVIIRAHGIAPDIEEELLKRRHRILDATCPHVKVSQNKAREFAEKGYWVFLAGEEKHAEIEGIRGYAETGEAASHTRKCYIAGSSGEAEKAAEELSRIDGGAKTVLIGQTTISAAEYGAIAEKIRQFFPSLEVVDTICGATSDRQESLRELCGKVDAVIVAGGKESSNARRLLSLAREKGKPAWLAETVDDLPSGILVYQTVGLSAGASTPDSLIDEIEEKLLMGSR